MNQLRTYWVAPNTICRMAKYQEIVFQNQPGARAKRSEFLIHLISMEEHTYKHLAAICSAFRKQFPKNNYRRTSDALIDISADMIATATSNFTANGEQINISIGLLFALEDFWQCVVSDNNTDLHTYCGVPFDSPNPVARSVEYFHVLDKVRFYDYSLLSTALTSLKNMIKQFESSKGDGTLEDFLERVGKFHLFSNKMISLDEKRVHFGFLLSDISIHWILAHEDAHVYSGHTEFFGSELGISTDEMGNDDELFSKIHREIIGTQKGIQISKLRLLSELHADELACTRLVDYLFDDEIFYLNPILIPEVPGPFYSGQDKKEARFLTIMRVAITSAIGSIFMFYRQIEKKNLVVDNYPQIDVRIANIIFCTLFRAFRRLKIPEASWYQNFSFPDEKYLISLGIGISRDITVMNWNLLRHPALLDDPELPNDKKLHFSEFDKKLDKKSTMLKFVSDAIRYTVAILNSKPDIEVLAIVVESDTVYNMIKLQSEFYDSFDYYFRGFQLEKNSGLKAKFDQTFEGIKNRSKDLKKLSELSTILKAEINIPQV